MQQEMQRKISAIPGVSSAAFANSVPTDGNNSTDLLYAEDRTYRGGTTAAAPPVQVRRAGLFSDHGNPADRRTRSHLDRHLRQNATWSLISENMARELWHDPSAALGKRIREGMKDPWREIVGVVAGYPRRWRRSEAAHHRLLAGHDEEFLGQ